MKRFILCFLFFLSTHVLFAQGDGFLIDFEYPVLPPNSDYTQLIGPGFYYYEDYVSLSKFYGRKNADSSFEGFTISNVQDSVTPGVTNNRAAFPAIGYNSPQYAVGHGVSGMYISPPQLLKPAQADSVYGFYVTNATIDVLSMEYGDSTAKKFGGMSGADPDWLKLTITGYHYFDFIGDSVGVAGSVAFYLADFRSASVDSDYIVKDWRWVDLSALGWVDSLSFTVSSSDTDSIGLMNTPAYFCMDDLGLFATGGVHEVYQNSLISLYPNPAKSGGSLYLKASGRLSAKKMKLSLYDISGRLVFSSQLQSGQSLVLPDLIPGIYTSRLSGVSGQLADIRKLLIQ